MSSLVAPQANLVSPMVLAFALEIVATFVRSDLKLPEAVYDGPAIYLLLAIGLKGGARSRLGRRKHRADVVA